MSSFLVHLKIKESAFQGAVTCNGRNYNGSFIRVSDDIFLLKFKQKPELIFKKKTDLKSRTKTFRPVIPLFSECNKKRLVRYAKILIEKGDRVSVSDAVSLTIAIEKFLSVNELRGFFSMEHRQLLDILVRLERDKEVKLMDVGNLSACSYKVFTDNFSNIVEKLITSYNSRIKTIKFIDIAGKVLFHPDSVYFRYLLEKARPRRDFRILKDKLVFTELPLSEKETSILAEVEKTIKKHKLGVFSIFSIRKVSGIEIDKINNSLWNMLSEGKIVPLDEKREYFIFAEELAKIINRLKKFKRNQGDFIDIASFREISVLNRKNIILVLEYLDSQKVTTRIGNNRKIELPV